MARTTLKQYGGAAMCCASRTRTRRKSPPNRFCRSLAVARCAARQVGVIQKSSLPGGRRTRIQPSQLKEIGWQALATLQDYSRNDFRALALEVLGERPCKNALLKRWLRV